MADIVSEKKRSEMMSGIRGKDTKPELIIRKGLHRSGYRFKLHDSQLPGKPDLVFPKYNAIIFIHGCFWHKHDCHLFKWPSSRDQFWKDKLLGNEEKDKENNQELLALGWRILIIWECALKGKTCLYTNTVLESAAEFLESDDEFLEIRGAEE